MAPERSQFVHGNQLRNSASILNSSSHPPGPFGVSSGQTGTPPPIPPRQSNSSYSGYNDYRQPFGSNYYGGTGYGYGYGSQYRSMGAYGSYGSYSPYSNMGGYNNYGMTGGPSGDVESRFLQYAEESTRSTFKVVETVLQTFSSLTMLLESTYFAMTNSFRAILSVAENIGRLRSTLGQLLSTFALIRFLKWMYRKLMHITGIRTQDSTEEELWTKSMAKVDGENPIVPSSWSGILMFSVFIIIPYVIHRISSNMKVIQSKGTDPREWYKCEEPMYTATVQYDFMAANSEELSLRAGQKIYLAPQSLQPKNLPGWCRATDNTNTGLVPSNYITIVGQLKKKPKADASENITSATVSQAATAPMLNERHNNENSMTNLGNTTENTKLEENNSEDIS